MNSRNYIERLMQDNFKVVSQIMKIVLICGPRQCGKTTLMRHMLGNENAFVSFDYPDMAQYVADSPRSFLNRYLTQYKQVGLDEFQKVPNLLGVIKAYADEMQESGRILLSGSSNFRAFPHVNESMAGRLGEVRLRTFTEAEKKGYKKEFLTRLLKGDYGPNLSFEQSNKDEIIKRALTGGYPALIDKPVLQRRQWFRNYLNAIIEKDLSDLGSFRKKDALSLIMQVLSSYSSRQIKFSEIAQATNIDQRTIKNYVQALQTMYLVDEVPAWQPSRGLRYSEKSKWFVTDSGLMSALQGHYDFETFTSWLLHSGKAGTDFVGNLVETFVYTQLIPYIELAGDWSVFHVRADQRYEIDLLLEHESGRKVAIEIKSSDNVSKTDFKNIEWFKQVNAGAPIQGVVLYCGNEVQEYDNGNVALPIAKFWMD